MEKIVLCYTYSAKNAGDMAITLGALDLLTKTGNRITTISRYSVNDKQYWESYKYLKNRYPQIEQLPSPFELNRETSGIDVLKQYLNGLLRIAGLKRNLKFKSTIQGFNKVYFNGGNLLRCSSVTDFIRLVALLYPLRLAIRSKIPVIILPQSTTRINWLGRMLLKPVLTVAKRVYCREELTYKVLLKYFPKAPIILNTDLAFFINHGFTNNYSTTKTIAITARSQTIGDIKELPANKKEIIVNHLVAVTKELLKHGYQIHFVIQTKKDRNITKLLFEAFSENKNVNLIEIYDPIELIKFYSNCDLLIGMRLHSIILALTSGTPCIGYFKKSWGLKNPGIIKAYNQECVFVEDEDNLLITLVNSNRNDDLLKKAEMISHKIHQFQNNLIID